MIIFRNLTFFELKYEFSSDEDENEERMQVLPKAPVTETYTEDITQLREVMKFIFMW